MTQNISLNTHTSPYSQQIEENTNKKNLNNKVLRSLPRTQSFKNLSSQMKALGMHRCQSFGNLQDIHRLKVENYKEDVQSKTLPKRNLIQKNGDPLNSASNIVDTDKLCVEEENVLDLPQLEDIPTRKPPLPEYVKVLPWGKFDTNTLCLRPEKETPRQIAAFKKIMIKGDNGSSSLGKHSSLAIAIIRSNARRCTDVPDKYK